MVYSTDRSKAVVPVLVLLFVALWFILRGVLLYVFPCVILFLCFSVLLVLRLPRLGKRATLSAFRTFVRFVLVWICRFPIPLGIWEGLRFVIVVLHGLFSYLFLKYSSSETYGQFSSTFVMPSVEKGLIFFFFFFFFFFFINGYSPFIKLTPCSYMFNKMRNIFSKTKKALWLNLFIQHQGLYVYHICSNDNPRLTFDILRVYTFVWRKCRNSFSLNVLKTFIWNLQCMIEITKPVLAPGLYTCLKLCNIKMTSPLKPLDQLSLNYIRGFLPKWFLQSIQKVLHHWSTWPPRPYMVKHILNSSSPESNKALTLNLGT